MSLCLIVRCTITTHKHIIFFCIHIWESPGDCLFNCHTSSRGNAATACVTVIPICHVNEKFPKCTCRVRLTVVTRTDRYARHSEPRGRIGGERGTVESGRWIKYGRVGWFVISLCTYILYVCVCRISPQTTVMNGVYLCDLCGTRWQRSQT